MVSCMEAPDKVGGKQDRKIKTHDEILDRIPPRDTDSEVQVLGSILARPELIDDVSLMLSADEFFDSAHQRLFQCLLDMREEGKYCDIALLVSKLKARGDFEAIGGGAYLVRLRDAIATTGHWAYHARLVRECAARRHLIEAGVDVIRSSYEDTDEPVSDLIENARSKLEEISQHAVVRNTADTSIKTVLHATLESIDKKAKGEVDFMRTGIHGLDRIMGGVRRKELTVIGARPSQGKSSLLAAMAVQMSMVGQCKTLFLSLEMSSAELADRMICYLSGVNGWRLRNGTLTAGDRQLVIRECARLSQATMWIPEQSSMTVSQIAATIRYHQRRSGCDVVMIDYLQLVVPEGGNRQESRQQQIGRITRKLKQISREMNVAMLVAAQVNRENAKTSSAPKLHHLREAGDIEADSDLVIMCHMPGAYDIKLRPERQDEGENAELIIEKNRNGPTGQTEMWYRRSCARWEDKADDEDSVSREPDRPRHSEFDDFNGPPEQEPF